jgi:hypothetical protein
MYSYCKFMYIHRANWHSPATLTAGFPCFFLSSKANAKGMTRKDGARPALFQNFCVVLCILCFVSFSVLFVCKCVLPPGDYPIAVNKYIVSYIIYHIYIISYYIIPYHTYLITSYIKRKAAIRCHMFRLKIQTNIRHYINTYRYFIIK